ncbi:MAG: hypothetical protein AB7Y46_18955 [Armatimonadota bacterium]
MRQGKGSGGASTVSIDLMTKLVAWAASGLKLSMLFFVICSVYLLWAVYGGYLNQAVDQRILNNLQLVGQVMALSGVLGTICLVIVTHEEVAYSVVAGLIGLAYIFGFPLMVAAQISGPAQRAGEIILNWGNITGQAMLVVVGLRVLLEIATFVKEAPLRREKLGEAEGLVKEKPKYVSRGPLYRLSRCWEMPYCHEAIKEMCPAYKARRSCWRIRQGCNCDPYLIESLLRRGAGKQISHEDAAYVRSDLTQARLAGSQRTRQCRNCPIFNEHQREKFRLLNPVLITATVVGILAAYPVMRGLYTAFINFMAALARQFSLGAAVPVDRWIQRLDSPAVWIFFYIIVGLLILSYVLKAIEWAVLQRKLV